MNRETLEEQAIEYALGVLPREDVFGFEAILKEDRELQSLVYDYQRLNEVDAQDAPREELPFTVYSRVMGQIDREAQIVRNSFSKEEPAKKVVSFFAWSGWAVAAACVAVLFGLNTWQVDTPEMAKGSEDIMLFELGSPSAVGLVQGEGGSDFESRIMKLTDLAETYSYTRAGLSPDAGDAVVSAPTGGFSIYDNKYKIGYFEIDNLPTNNKAGTGYHVWVTSRSGKVLKRAGGVDAAHRMVFFDLSQVGDIEDFDDDVSFFVTEEDVASPSVPSDKVVLTGI